MRKFVLALLLFCCGPMLGQAPGTGNYAFGTFDARGFDSINVGNLNVSFSIPIVSRSGRGLPFIYTLNYQGLIWSAAGVSGSQTWAPDPNWGFQGQLNGTGVKGYMTHTTVMVPCTNGDLSGHAQKTPKTSNFAYHDEFGIIHRFDYSFTAACEFGDPSEDVVTGDGTADDNSGYSLNTDDTFQVLTRSGQVITPARSPAGQDAISIVDSNGNTISGDGSGVLKDTLGASALTISGSSPRVFTYPVILQAGGATTASATLSYQTYTVRTSFQCSGVGEYGSTSVSLPSQLTLADGSFYAFTYEGTAGATDGAVTGRLASVTLPTGGTISYTYIAGCGAGINADGTVGSLTRTTSDGTRQYNRSPNNSNSTFTDVIDEKGNDTHYAFSIDANSREFFETHRQVHQGGSNGPVIEDQYTCYNGATGNCDGAVVTLPMAQTDVIQSFNGGSQRLTRNQYDTNGTLLTDSKVYNGTTLLYELLQSFNSLGEMTQRAEQDGNGTPFSYTYNNYDEGTVAGTSNIPQHGAPGNVRGNLTSTHTSAGSTYLNSSITYFDTGQPQTSTAPDGGVTQYNYDSVQGFVTLTNLPATTSGVALTTGAQTDLTTAAVLAVGGVAGDTTSVTQYDALMRPTGVTLPSRSTLAKSIVSFPTWTRLSQTLDSQRTAATDTQLDGYGRVSRVAVHNSNPNGGGDWYQTDYCYDAAGLLQFQSSAYQANGIGSTTKKCSGSGTSYQYDALGRVTGTTNDDGTASTTYQGRAVQTTDVNQVSRITQYDLLGRISSVCEVSSTSYGGQSPSACPTDLGGTGYVTTYSYSLNSAYPVTTISQGGQTRTFQTDNAGRTMSVQEPERGTTTYGYAYNGTGLQVTRTRSKANQTNTAVKTNTVTQYDRLGRVVSTTYDDNLTQNKSLSYDVSPSGLGWSTVPSNVKGRLAAMNTGNTRAQFSYDISGNVTDMWQCAPSICGTGNQQSRPTLHYTYDLSGAILSAFDGASGTIAYTRSVAGEVLSVTNQTYTDAGNTPNLVSNVANGPFGPKTWSLGNGLTGVANFDGLGRSTGIFACVGSSQTSCNGGSLQVYGNTTTWKGSRVIEPCDTQLGCSFSSYDDLNRLTALNNIGSGASYSYAYDRYGNRVSANGVGYSYNGNNQQSNNGYDAAGNQLTDGSHSYTYDAEGKILQVDGGTTASYAYDALGHRVRVTTQGSDTEYLFDPFGRRQSSWVVSGNIGNEGRIYWDRGLLANRSVNGQTYYHHANYLGTERVRTNYQGQTVSTQRSGPFGEGLSQTVSDSNGAHDNNQYTGQDHDAESNTSHFLYRQYSEGSGRWMSPDPYDGSYDASSPQSLNRYGYVLNNPLALVDPDGQQIICYTQTAYVDGVYDSSDSYCEETNTGGGPSGGSADGGAQHGGGGGGGSSSTASAPDGHAPNKTACNIQRATSAGMGAANLGLAAGKGATLGGAVAGLAATGAGAPAAAVLAVYGTVSILGQGLTGAAQLYSAATGKYGTAARVAQIGNILSGPVSGLGTLLRGGSLAAAERNAGYESAFTAGSGLVDAIRAGGAGLPLAMADHSTAQLSMFGVGGGNACAAGH